MNGYQETLLTQRQRRFLLELCSRKLQLIFFNSRGEVDISTLEAERTHFLEVELEDNAGIIELLLTVSGTSGTESISDLGAFVADPNRERELIKRYVSMETSLQYR